MNHLIRKLSYKRCEVLAHVKMGKSSFNLLRDGSCYKALLNGSEILTLPVVKDGSRNHVKALSDLVCFLAKETSPKGLSIHKQAGTELVDEIVKGLSPEFSKKQIVIKEMPKDPGIFLEAMQSNSAEKGASAKPLLENLESFRSSVVGMCHLIGVLHEASTMLTRGRLVDSMWGAKNVQGILDCIKHDIVDDPVFRKMDLVKEMTEKSTERLSAKLSCDCSQQGAEEKRIIGAVLIPSIIQCFETLKEMAAKMLLGVGNLVNIDQAFKKHTNFPANWFLDTSMLDNLQQDYQSLLKFFLQVPVLEVEVIDPLENMSLQTIAR